MLDCISIQAACFRHRLSCKRTQSHVLNPMQLQLLRHMRRFGDALGKDNTRTLYPE